MSLSQDLSNSITFTKYKLMEFFSYVSVLLCRLHKTVLIQNENEF